MASKEEWQKLLLYQRDNGRVSLVRENSKFFLNPHGRNNPDLELETTKKTFLNPAEFISRGEGHPQCLYPARLKYLQKYHSLSVEPVHCPSFTEWKKRLKGEEVSIVFATQFVGNPASVMGHTFLKFKDPSVKDFLHVSIGYAAEVREDDNSFLYAWKGLTGGYRGKIFDNPYYEKVHEYNNMEQRDIWEFKLNLTPDEIDQLMNLIWEMKVRAEFDYYFLDENCSYMIMAMIEAVTGKELTDGYGIYTAPYVTLLKLEENGLISDKKFRPSLRSQLMHDYDQLSDSQKSLAVKDLREIKIQSDQPASYYDVMISASLYEKHRKDGKLSEERRNFLNQAMLFRSKLETPMKTPLREPSSPLKAHHARFVSFGIGNLSDDHYQSLEFRPGVHHLNDPSAGFLENSSISFMETKLRYYDEHKQLTLGEFKLVQMQNTNFYEPIDPRLSWKLSLQYNERDLLVRDDGSYEGQFLIGGAISLQNLSFLMLPGVKQQYSTDIENKHVMWLKTDLTLRHQSEAFLMDLTLSPSRSVINGPDSWRLDSSLDLRLYLPNHHLQLAPRLSYQKLLEGKNDYFDHSLNVIYDF